MKSVSIVGGGLSGCEAAWQLADRGIAVRLYEMRPRETTEAHRSDKLAEIVCTNSFKSILPDTASGILKAELGLLGCKLLDVARQTSVPAGHALAVDREQFSDAVTAAIESHPNITTERKRQDDLDIEMPAVIATGPLTAPELSASLRDHCSQEHLYFYDAIAPSIETDSINPETGYLASRYNKGEADYLNIPLDETEYKALIKKIKGSELVTPHGFEDKKYFEACLPIEVMAARGEDTARFGPMRPIGLADPRTGREPYAVIQLRRESQSGNLLGFVGFQTRMTYGAQKEMIRSLPGCENARILRYGSIHRNIYLNLPALCTRYQKDKKVEGLYYAGQICGVEGYVECITSGLIAALSVFAGLKGETLNAFPPTTMIGSLMNYIHTPRKNFQPMNANMGILPSTGKVKGDKRARYLVASQGAVSDMTAYREANRAFFSLDS